MRLNNVIYDFFGNIISIKTNNSELLQQLNYIYRDYIIYDNQKIDYYMEITCPVNTMITSVLLTSDEMTVYHGSDEENLKKWDDTESSFLPPITLPFFRNKYSFFHGCGIQLNGKNILVFGPSKAGKSTLMMRLLEDGGKLITDDLLVINNKTKEIIPFKKPMGLRSTTKEFYEKRFRNLIEKLPSEVPSFYFRDTGLITELIHINDVPGWDYSESQGGIHHILFIGQDFRVINDSFEFFSLIQEQSCLSNNPVDIFLNIYQNLESIPQMINTRELDKTLKVINNL